MVEDNWVGIDGEPAALVELRIAAQIDDSAQTEWRQRGDVARCQAIEAVGTEEHTPPRCAAIGRCVSAEIPEVVHRFERYQSSGIWFAVGEHVSGHEFR